MSSEAQIGTVVRARVKRILPFGLLVEVNGHDEGIVREREITWDQKTSAREFRVGQTIEVTVLSRGKDGLLNLSLRLVQHDPWENLSSRYHEGQLIDGVVTGIQTYGVFVEIEPGVTGLLHYSQLPDWVQGECADLFWPGDHVYLSIKKIDLKKRRISLSLIDAWQKRWAGTIQNELSETETPNSQGSKHHTNSSPLLPLELIVRRSHLFFIAVVEDDLTQRQAMTKWLQKTGQNVKAFEVAETAIAHMKKEQFDLVLMDVGLPGMNGIKAMQEIIKRYPETHGVIMTDWACANEYLEELNRLHEHGVSLLIKPLLPEDLLRVLSDTGATDKDEPKSSKVIDAKKTKPLAETEFDVEMDDSLEKSLRDLCRLTYASKAILFGLDTAQRKINIIAENGQVRTKQGALIDLIYSPVREVAEDQMTITVDALSAEGARAQYLASFLSFGSCIGVPVIGEGIMQYALFLFHSNPGFFTSIHREYAQAVAIALGANLRSRQLHHQMVKMQRLTLLGNLTRGLVHEINHKLTPISFALDELQGQCMRVEQYAERSVDDISPEIHDARTMLHDLSLSFQKLVQTARLFGRLTVQGQEQLLRLDTVVEETVQLIRDKADRAHVIINVKPLTKILVTRSEVVQVQQILLNVFLNAILQIENTRPGIGGRLYIQIQQVKVNNRVIFQIAIEDDGPGIHRRLWDRVFDLGFSIGREEGSGLGLYITRSLIEGMGGCVYIAESHLFWGTKFIIELPLRL